VSEKFGLSYSAKKNLATRLLIGKESVRLQKENERKDQKKKKKVQSSYASPEIIK
jgi:hypothetical protein